VVDQGVSGNRKQPGEEGSAARVIPLPGTKRSLEGELGEILGLLTGMHPVSEIAVDMPDVIVVGL
jgi:hypothetical protein